MREVPNSLRRFGVWVGVPWWETRLLPHGAIQGGYQRYSSGCSLSATIGTIDYRVFRLINDFAEALPWLDRTMALLAEYAPLHFVATLLGLWIGPSGERGKFPDRLAGRRALVFAHPRLSIGLLLYFLGSLESELA